nr:RNA-directed DNA polymerase, eukaryota, reverse transcriptase zinc-binding domain protein [Tanacetum cinerariifolium]
MKEKVDGCILADMMDRWFWALEGSGEFIITSVRKMIDDFMLPEMSSKTRWIKAVPIKDPNMFKKTNSTVSGYFVMVRGDWMPNVSKEEIKKAVWDCGIDKSPGPDGFTFGFYRRYWKLIENDVVDAVTSMMYDSVRWDHLDDIMRKFGFGEKWCMWIQSCLRSSRGLVIVNGSHTEEFQFYKCLKQGDPLYHFLFILVMESLHISFQRVVDVGLFKGIEIALSLNLSHMFYADDAIFMGQWSESNIDIIVKLLDCFNRASGLRIYMTKSKLLGISVEDDKVKQAVAKIGCNTLKTPFSYLGSKVGGCMSRIQSWNETIKRMACRLSKWKLKTLSIGGMCNYITVQEACTDILTDLGESVTRSHREKITAIEESKDLSSLALDELIGNLKVHKVIMEKDSEICKGKGERVKSIVLKAKRKSSDDETSTFVSDYEEYVVAVRDFKMFFRRKGRFVRQPCEEKNSF